MKSPVVPAALSALLFFATATVSFLPSPLFAADAAPAPSAAKAPTEVKPNPVTATFYVSNVKCSACVYSVEDAIKKVPSVTKVEGLTEFSGFIQVSFDTHAASYHQVANAVGSAIQLHGEPYVPSIKIRIPDYAKGDNAAKIDAIFAKSKDFVTVETRNKEKGLFEIQFKPLTVDAAKKGPQGWNAGRFGHPIHDPAPKGLGLAFQVVKEE